MELNSREKRAVMLETQRPAYARSDEARRAIDQIYQRARNLTKALPAGISASVRAVVPHQNQYVSGLNVPSNFQTVVGRQQANHLSKMQKRAIKALEKRNG